MFTLAKFEKSDSGIYIEINCQFITSELIVMKRNCKSVCESQRFFNFVASDFLAGQIDEFGKVVEFIKPHYFDKSLVPFMQLANDWRTAYFDFKYKVIPSLSESFLQPGNYAKLVLKFEWIFKNLITTLPQLGQAEMIHMFTDIIYCAKKITETLAKMKSQDLKQNFLKTA